MCEPFQGVWERATTFASTPAGPPMRGASTKLHCAVRRATAVVCTMFASDWPMHLRVRQISPVYSSNLVRSSGDWTAAAQPDDLASSSINNWTGQQHLQDVEATAPHCRGPVPKGR